MLEAALTSGSNLAETFYGYFRL